MSEEQILAYIQRALELREEDASVDLAELCADHPDLIPAVAAALDLRDELPQTLTQDPLIGSAMDGRYVLQDWIGAGAMGAVYASLDRTLDRPVAVKVLKQGVLATEQRQQRFVREARVLASLDHPSIVRIFDYGLSDATFHYIVMERLVGASLSGVLEAQIDHEGAVTLPIYSVPGETLAQRDWLSQVATWGAQLASALESAHSAGVFHRDLKPSNVVVDSSGHAILIDFGIATREGEGSLTIGGTTLGTPWYMAPEQALDPTKVTSQVDVYGLCATLYHLATYQPPYDGNYQQVLVMLQSVEPPPPGHVRPELPSDLCAIIEKGMERDPRRRYESAAALESDLRAFLTHMPVSARPLTALGRRWRRIRARPAPWIAVAVVFVLLVGAVFSTVTWQDAQRENATAMRREYRRLFAGWPPAVAFEGTLATRPLLDPDERRADIARAEQILRIRPDDVYTRMLRCALLLDQGDHAASTADLTHVAESAGEATPYLSALLERYRQASVDTPGAGSIQLDGLPAPSTDLGFFVAAFHHARIKDYATADELLASAPAYLPARYMRLSVLASVGGAKLRLDPSPEEFRTVRAEALALEEEFGFPTARTRYYDGLAARWLRDYSGAIRSLQESAELSECFGTLINLAETERRLNRLTDVRKHYQAAARLRPWKMNALLGLARVLADYGEFDAATRLAQRVPIDGHLAEPWHRDFILGRIEMLRSTAAQGGGNDADVQASNKLAIEHFRNSLARAGANRRGSQLVTRVLRNAELLLADPSEAVARYLAELRRQPYSETYVRALVSALRQHGLPDQLEPDLIRFLESMATDLGRHRTGQDEDPSSVNVPARKK